LGCGDYGAGTREGEKGKNSKDGERSVGAGITLWNQYLEPP